MLISLLLSSKIVFTYCTYVPMDETFFNSSWATLQNLVLCLAAAGFLAQEAVDGKGILEHLGVSL